MTLVKKPSLADKLGISEKLEKYKRNSLRTKLFKVKEPVEGLAKKLVKKVVKKIKGK